MVGLVIVSHSATLAAGVVELARQMGAGGVAIEAAGGMGDADNGIGTDVELVRVAIERAAGPDGVLVLMDLGSAVMSAEMASEMLAAEDGPPVLLCEAPLVEGAVAAAARAGAGAPLDEVAAEARRAIAGKAAQLGVELGAEAGAALAAPAPAAEAGAQARLHVGIPLGLHARPAARIVETAGRFDVRLTITDETSGRGPADARSLTALMTLGARQGHDLLVHAAGPDAEAALSALRALADEGFGDEPGARAPAAAPAGSRPAPVPAARAAPPAEPPAPGTRLAGVPVAPGIAIGAARLAAAALPAVAEAADEPAGDPAAERARLDAALVAARGEIEATRDRVAERAGAADAAIFEAHLALLGDEALLDPARRAIDGGQGAVAAWRATVAATGDAYRGLDDAYLRERAADVEDVGAHVARALLGGDERPPVAAGEGILVMAELTPGAVAALDPEQVEGLAAAHGGATSHGAILAQGLGIPTVVGLGAAVLAVADGTPLVLDGRAGTVEVDPPAKEVAARRAAREAEAERRLIARERAREPAGLRDGPVVEVAANLGAAGEVAAALELGADGVGLLRTEFLFMNRERAPTDAEQRAVYEQIATALDGRPLIVRTLDAGADKPLPYLAQAPEDNPFLGVRGVRLGLAQPALLETQLRAILPIAARLPLRIMLPMVATLGEYRAARDLLERVRAEAGAPPVELGIMVEVPAVAVAADRFAREVAFFSIGTNDLGQYTMAAERGNEAVAPLLREPAPPVLRLVAAVVAAARPHGRWVGVCGELAGDPAAAVLLAGLGVDELSMAAPRIPEVKEALRGVALDDARAAAAAALAADDAGAARAIAEATAGMPAIARG